MRTERHWRPFPADPSCVLHLPFYKYGSEQSKILDISGQNNHGVITGAVPYPGNPQMTSVGSTLNRGDFTATNAFFWSSLNLSSYAGNDSGYTPYYIELLDGTGKKATGYIGATGAGETLDANIVAGWDFTSGWSNYSNATIIDSDSFTTSDTGGIMSVYGILSMSSLYAYTYVATNGHLVNGANGVTIALNDGVTKYDCTVYPAIIPYRLGAGNVDVTTLNVQRVTDPPATAVHIVSSLNGTTRNWASIESGFDPNTIASWKINGVIPKTAIGWYFDDVDDRIAHPSINFGKTHTLLYWLRSFANAKDIIHGRAANNHVAIDGTNLYYNAGATELSQAHGGGIGNSTMIGIARSGTTVQFFKNGIQVGADQVLDANNDLTLTTLGSYDTPGTFLGGVIPENLGFNRTLSAQEIRNYYELTKYRYVFFSTSEGGAPPSDNKLLLNIGDYLLLNSGDKILLNN